MSSKPTVLILVDDLGVGGAQRQVVELLKGLKRSGRFRVALAVFYRGGGLEPEAIAQADVLLPLRYRIRSAPFALLPFVRQVRGSGARLIHVTFGANSAVAGLLAARWLRLPVINGAIRNALPRLTFAFRVVRWCAARSDVIVANARAGLVAYGLASDPRARVVYNGIDLGRSSGVTPTLTDTPSICMVGNFTQYKDQATLIRAMAQVRAAQPAARLVLVGHDFGTLDACRRLTGELGLADAVEFKTDVVHPEAIVASSHVCVLASNTVTHGEGIANAILEYMTLGKPVVATACGGNAEVVRDGETGFLVPGQLPDVLAGRLIDLLAHPARARQMGEAGRQRVTEMFTAERMVSDFEAIYGELLTETRNAE